MAITHTGKEPVVLLQAPADPDGTDWVIFSYQDWIRDGESITAHSAIITGSSVAAASVYIGYMTDSYGVRRSQCYGVAFKPASGVANLSITHRVSTTSSSGMGRLNIDHSVVIPIKRL